MLYVFNGSCLYRPRTPEYPNSKCLLLETNYILTWNIMPSFIWIYAYNARIIILKWCSDREFQSHGFVGFFNAFCRIGDCDIHIFKKVLKVDKRIHTRCRSWSRLNMCVHARIHTRCRSWSRLNMCVHAVHSRTHT